MDDPKKADRSEPSCCSGPPKTTKIQWHQAKITTEERVADLRAPGHDIGLWGKLYRCAFCFLAKGKTGLASWLELGWCPASPPLGQPSLRAYQSDDVPAVPCPPPPSNPSCVDSGEGVSQAFEAQESVFINSDHQGDFCEPSQLADTPGGRVWVGPRGGRRGRQRRRSQSQRL